MDMSSPNAFLVPGAHPGLLHQANSEMTTHRATRSASMGALVYDHVSVQGDRVLWGTGNNVRKCLTLHAPVLHKAVWAAFPEYGHKDVLCLLHATSVTTAVLGGTLHDTPLPGPTESLWPCTQGLLLVAPCSSGVHLLRHPLEEPQPVLADVSVRAGVAGSYAGWSGEDVVWSSSELPFVATYSKDARRLALWRLELRHVRSALVGNLPDLPAHTPAPNAATPQSAITGLHTQTPVHRHAHGHAGMRTPGAFTATPMSVTQTQRSTPHVGWASAMKQPTARTPDGRLSPALFNPAPRTPGCMRATLAHVHISRAGGAPGAVSSMGGPLSALGASFELGSHGGTGIRPLFTLLHEQPLVAAPNAACLVTDGAGAPLLSVMCAEEQRLHVFALPCAGDRSQEQHLLFSLPALGAAAVCATCTPCPTSPLGGHLVELLVLRPDHQLWLYQGELALCHITYQVPSGPGPHYACPMPIPQQGVPLPPAKGQGLPQHAQQHQAQPASQEDDDMDMASPVFSTPAQAAKVPATPAYTPTPQVLLPPELLPTSLTDAHGERVTVGCAGGARVRLQLCLQALSPLTAAMLYGVRAALQGGTRHSYLQAVYGCKDIWCGAPEREWAALLRTTVAWVQGTSPPPGAAAGSGCSSPPQPRPPVQLADLFGTPQTQRFAAMSLASPAPGAAVSAGSGQLPAGRRGAWEALLTSTQHARVAGSGKYAWLHTPPAPAALTPRAALEGTASHEQSTRQRSVGMTVLSALHLVYEDVKLCTQRWPQLQPFGTALAQLASVIGPVAAAHWEYYARDLGPRYLATCGITSPQLSLQHDNTPATPLDVHRVLERMLHGHPPPAALAVSLAQLPPTTLQRMRDVLACYTPLMHCARRCNAVLAGTEPPPSGVRPADHLQVVVRDASHALVVAITAQRWSCVQLDTLPLGVALPLREALQRCRGAPPTGWPVEAYALVGREDIAATLAASQHWQPSAPQVVGWKQTPGVVPGATPDLAALHSKQVVGSTPLSALPFSLAGATPYSALSHMGGAGVTPALALGQGQGQGQGARGGSGQQQGPTDATSVAAQGGQARVYAEDWGRGNNSDWYAWQLPFTQRLHLPAHHLDSGPRRAHLQDSLAGGVSGAGAASVAKEALKFQEMWDGFEGLRKGGTRLRFSRDARLADVSSLLSSSGTVMLGLDAPDGDPEVIPAKQQQQLMAAAVRTMALAMGRGALTLGTARPLPTEPLVIPPLCLSGVLPEQHYATVNLDLSTAQPAPGGGAAADITAWAEFHNGAAAGLRMAAEGGPGLLGSSSNGSSATLTRNWIVFHRPDTPSYTHAGLLMALGLAGHLTKLSWTDLYRYLSEQHDATTIGVMLGMAASRRGSMDGLVSKMLFLHLPATHPSSFPEIELSPLVQAAALLGVGLLYQGSRHRLMVETMLAEIGRRPGPPPGLSGMRPLAGGHAASAAASSGTTAGGVTQDREGYALAAGLALGLVTLGAGGSTPGLADLHIREQLKQYMLGGSDATAGGRKTAGSTHTLATSPAVLGPGRIGFDPTLGEERLLAAAALQGSFTGREPDADGGGHAASAGAVSQVVLESPDINLSITSPAATLALALMYLKTNDAATAACFVIPDTAYALARVRPDLVLLRVLGRSLVMWDAIEPSQAWVEAQLPTMYRGPLPALMDRLASVKWPGADVARSRDLQAHAHAHINVVAGACLAMGLKYAGSASTHAYGVLRGCLTTLLAAKRAAPDASPAAATGPLAAAQVQGVPPVDGASAAAAVAAVHRLDKGHLEAAVDVVVLALSLVMAGTGHLPTLQLLQALSRRRHPVHGAVVSGLGIHFGSHMAINMAAGFLFLGAGNATFNTSNEGIAALLISLFPRLPTSSTDHRCHLQAFRHLYVLAAQPRCVEAMDVDSRHLVYVPMSIHLGREAVTELSGVHASSPVPAGTAGGGHCSGERPGVLQVSSKPNIMLGNLSPAGGGGAWGVDSGRQEHTAGNAGSGPGGRSGVRGPSDSGTLSTVQLSQGSGSPHAHAQLERVAPCLLPELGKVDLVSINGPRYWPQVLTHATCSTSAACSTPSTSSQPTPNLFSPAPHTTPGLLGVSPLPLPAAGGGQASSLDRLYHRQLVFVKKKAGSLSYADDPTGIRSLLSRAFHTGQATPSGWHSTTGTGAGAGARSHTQGAPGSDIVHLCATFSADPSIMAFAQHVQQLTHLLLVGGQRGDALTPTPRLLLAAGASGASRAAAAATQPVHSASGVLQFCTAALYECISGEKAGCLDAYLQLFALVHAYQPEAAWQGEGAHAREQQCRNAFPGVPLWLAGTCITTTALRSIPLALASASSPVAVACSWVTAAVPGDSQGQEGAEAAAQRQLWAPLLQPVLVQGLWQLLAAAWKAHAFVPAAPVPVPATDTQPLLQFIRTGSLVAQQGRVAEGQIGEGSGEGSSKTGSLLDAFGACLALNHVPTGAELAALAVHVHESIMQGLPALVSSVSKARPDLPADAVLLLCGAMLSALAA